MRLLFVCWAALWLSVVLGACGGDDDGEPAAGSRSSVASFAEGDVRIEIEYLDTGLLKGHAYGDAAEEWTVDAIRVEAVDHEGAEWVVIEPERTGVGSRNATEFFEVVFGELPRGEQITITATVTFRGQALERVERAATDTWPP